MAKDHIKNVHDVPFSLSSLVTDVVNHFNPRPYGKGLPAVLCPVLLVLFFFSKTAFGGGFFLPLGFHV